MVGLERCEDGLDVLICLFAGQAAVIRAQDKVERHALLADGHAGAAVNIEQLDFPLLPILGVDEQ